MKIIGHRGARGLAPENTMVSLRKALQHQVDEIEFDLHVTQDGVVILHHDYAITDPNGDRLTIAKSSFQQLRQHKPDLATFQEVIDGIGNKVRLYIEVKPHVDPKPIIHMLQACLANGWQTTDFSIASFDIKILQAIQAAIPAAQFIINEPWSGVRARHRAHLLRTQRISMNQLWLWGGFIKGMSRRYELSAYTLNNPKKAARWAKSGLAGIITDYPDRFKAK